MHQLVKRLLMSTVALVPAGVHAQDLPLSTGIEVAEQDAGLADIIVTAQRREQNLQQVPIAVTALTADTLDKLQFSDVSDLNGLAPGLQVRTTSGATPIITMRGMNAGGFVLPGLDSPIALYIDGVYIARGVGTLFDIAELERVEVLRGPQGTLFGRNATIGAINFITKGPTGKLEVQQDFSAGNRDYFRSRTRINLPEWNGFSAQISYMHSEEDGWVRNLGRASYDFSLVTGGRVGVLSSAPTLGLKNVEGVNVAVRFVPSPELRFDYRFDYSDNLRTDPPIQIIGFPGTAGGAIGAGIFNAQPAIGGFQGNFSTTRLRAVDNRLTSVQHLVVWGHSLTAAYDVSENITLKSITGYRRSKIDGYGTDNRVGGGLRNPTPGPSFGQDFYYGGTVMLTSSRQFTQELQFLYNSDRFDLTAGGFYFYEHSPFLSPSLRLQSLPQAPAQVTRLGGGLSDYDTRNKSYAGYAQGTFSLTDRLDLTGGIRYTHDNRSTELRSVLTGVGALPIGTYKRSFERTDYTGIISYNFADTATGYAKVSTGYTSGGILSGLPFKPQILTSYEGGIKTELFDKRLRFNVAGYFLKVKDLQVASFTRGFLEMTNAGKASGRGLEFELQAVPTRNVTVSAGLTLQKYKFLEYVQNGVNLGSRGTNTFFPTQGTPLIFNFSANWDFLHFENGARAFAMVDGAYRGRLRSLNSRTGNPVLDDIAFFVKPQRLINARLGVTEVPMGELKASIALWARNVFDEDRLEFSGNTGFVATGIYTEPRRIGMDVSFKF